MLFTFYKNCILNSNYDEVFYSKEVLDQYLGGLQKIDVVVADGYADLSGKLVLKKTDNLTNFDYNYIKIFGDTQVTYAFVNSIEFANQDIILTYTQDIWSTYLGKWSMRKSRLSSTRYPNKYSTTDEYYLPKNYKTNYPLVMEGSNTSHEVNIIVEFQYYVTGQVGNVTNRVTQYALLQRPREGTTPSTDDSTFRFSLQDACTFAVRLMNFTGYKEIFSMQEGSTGTDIYNNNIQITNFYFVPADWQLSRFVGEHVAYERTVDVYTLYKAVPSSYYFFHLVPRELTDTYYHMYGMFELNDKQYVFDTEIQNDFKNVSKGFVSKLSPTANNGRKEKYAISIYKTQSDLYIYQETADGILDITSEFAYMPDVATDSAESLYTKRIARMVGSLTNTLSASSSIAKTMTLGKPVSKTISSGANYNEKYRTWDIDKNITRGGYSRSYEQVMGEGAIAGNTISLVSGAGNNIANMLQLQAKAYTSNHNSPFIPASLLNAYYGFITLRIDEDRIINEQEVEKTKNEVGYVVDYVIDNIDNTIVDYDILTFAFVRIVGLTSEINAIIKGILLNGVKIWYTKNV